MKQIFAIGFLFIIISKSFAQQGVQKLQHAEIQSTVYNTTRYVSVYLPDEYFNEPERKFEVLYVLDAQNNKIFNVATSIAEYLAPGQSNPMIIVGIKTTERWDEFLPAIVNPETTNEIEGYFGKEFKMGNAHKLIRHLNDEVFPWVEKQYRTLSPRIAIGHSLGGTFLTYATVQHPELFTATISISPNLVFDKEEILNKIKAFKNEEIPLNAYSYITYGRKDSYETSFYPATQKAIALFEKYRKDGIVFNHKEFPDANHFTILPQGIEAGLLDYHTSIFLNGANAVKYYKTLEVNKELTLTADQINTLAYNCFWNDRTDDAITIMKWGHEKFPQDYNLHDSMGEFLEAKKNIPDAKKQYEKAIQLLAMQKTKLDKKTYDEKMSFYLGNLKRVSN